MAATALLLSRSESAADEITREQLIGVWTLKQMRGYHGRVDLEGVIEGEMSFSPDGTFSGKHYWTKRFNGEKTVPNGFSGTWTLSGSILNVNTSDNGWPDRSKVRRSDEFLIIEPDENDWIEYYYLRKSDAQPGATDNPDDAQRLREDH